MKKRFALFTLLLLSVLLFASCGNPKNPNDGTSATASPTDREEETTTAGDGTETQHNACQNGHTPAAEAATCNTAQICTVCGEVLADKLDHVIENNACVLCKAIVIDSGSCGEAAKWYLLAESATDELYDLEIHGTGAVTSAPWRDPIDAFKKYRNTIETVLVKEGITSIKSDAFRKCASLKSVIIRDGIERLEWCTFAECTALRSIELPETVTSIGPGVFMECGNLICITIPSGVTSIEDTAFLDCYRLVQIFNRSNLSICAESDAYGGVGEHALNVYTPSDGENRLHSTDDGYVFYDDGEKRYLIAYHGSDTALALPNNCNGKPYEIYPLAFQNCTQIKSVTVEGGVTSIGAGAFGSCTELTTVAMSNSVESMGIGCFSGCSALTTVTLSDDLKSIDHNVFRDCSSLTSITIPDGVTSIGDYAFYGCESLNAVYITDIEAWCKIDFLSERANPLAYSKNLYVDGELLTTLVVPSSVTSIKKYAFINCASITDASMADSVKSIEEYAFYGCMGLTDVVIPEGVRSIGNGAFQDCTGLTDIELPNSLTDIGSSAFYHCIALTDVVIPEGVRSIGNGAFQDCTGLTNVTIPSSVTNIATFVFSGCVDLGDIQVAKDNAVYHSDGNCLIDTTQRILLFGGKNCLIPTDGSVTSIWHGALARNVATEITIPDGVTSIGNFAFVVCANLTNVTIPKSVTSIGDQAFYDCLNMESITYQGTVEEWEAVTKSKLWNDGAPAYIVHCTDGDISEAENQ